MLKNTLGEVDGLIETLQNAALNVLHAIELKELRFPLKGTVPQLYLTISTGRTADIEFSSLPVMNAGRQIAASHGVLDADSTS